MNISHTYKLVFHLAIVGAVVCLPSVSYAWNNLPTVGNTCRSIGQTVSAGPTQGVWSGAQYLPSEDEEFDSVVVRIARPTSHTGGGLVMEIYEAVSTSTTYNDSASVGTLLHTSEIVFDESIPEIDTYQEVPYLTGGVRFRFDDVSLASTTGYNILIRESGGPSTFGVMNDCEAGYVLVGMPEAQSTDSRNIIIQPSWNNDTQRRIMGVWLSATPYGGMIWSNEGNSYIPVTSDITSTTTWAVGNTYVVSGDISIYPNVALTVQAGTVVKFDTSTSSSLTVNGTLNAFGEKDDEISSWVPVVFTSIEDDNVGNPFDTSGNGTTTPPAAGDWGGIRLEAGGIANLYGTIVRYAETGIHNDGGNLLIASSTVAFNDTNGIYNESGTTEAYSVDLGFQDYGLYVDGGSVSITASSTIHDNTLYGIYNDTISTVDAEGNYWATSTGPSALVGSAVNGSVDYTPYVEFLHFVNLSCTSGGQTCASVVNEALLYSASTTYSSELNSAVNTWNTENKVSLVSTTTNELLIRDANATDLSDVSWKGYWSQDALDDDVDLIELNPYYLDVDSYAERQHTITHELGHALGLLHSYTGNILYYNQSLQTSLGPQDLFDYHYLWQ